MASVKNSKHRPVEIFRDISGRNRFRVRARNGRVLATSQAYASRWGARRGAAALLRVLQEPGEAGAMHQEEAAGCSRTNS
ncbi:MAG: DUF1508 domain-containing protein [Nitrospinae bacterium]|nr:DUF1508 domain-containing protein [Nitrospinota bacterium]